MNLLKRLNVLYAELLKYIILLLAFVNIIFCWLHVVQPNFYTYNSDLFGNLASFLYNVFQTLLCFQLKQNSVQWLNDWYLPISYYNSLHKQNQHAISFWIVSVWAYATYTQTKITILCIWSGFCNTNCFGIFAYVH